MNRVINRDLAKRVLETVDKGLCKGVGQPEPGGMCVEAAVCFAMGMPHGDEPACVGSAVRAFKIGLNDADWSSNAARAKGMRRVAIAQLGSDKLDQGEFSRRMAIAVVREILPAVLRAAGDLIARHREALYAAAAQCAAADSAASAALAADSADSATSAASAAGAASAIRAASAARAAYSAVREADSAADSAAYSAARAVRGGYLSKSAEIAVRVLTELGCEGCQWLDLTEGE